MCKRRDDDLMPGCCWVSRVVDQDEFAEVELVGEPFPFGLVQDAFVVVVSASENVFLCQTALSPCPAFVPDVCVCVCLRGL